MDKLMRAEVAQQKVRRHVRKHQRIAREALWDTDDAQTALGAILAQMVLVGQQRDEANHCVEESKEDKTRTMVLAGRQAIEFDQMEQEYMRRLQHAQNTIVELQHDVHHLNNIINPIPPPDVVEEEDLEMLIEEDEPDEDVKPMEDNDDEPMPNIDSDHSDK